jgi:hypothetical protein
MSAAAALAVATVLAGCGTTTYYAGRTLPPSGVANRVLITVQNPSSSSTGALRFVDAYYDIRSSYDGKTSSFSISGYSGSLPTTIQNMPEEQLGAVYGSGDNSFYLINYAKEATGSSAGTLNGASSSVYITRNQSYVFAANQTTHVLTVIDKTSTGGSYALSLPGVYRVSVNPGGTVALAFVQNSNYVYYPRKLTAAETTAFSGGSSYWPKNAVDCKPLNSPGWCLFQAQSPDTAATDSAGNSYYYGAPLTFDRPTKAVFSSDGGTAYVLSCGPECGGTASAITPVSIAPMIYIMGEASGKLPTTTSLASAKILIPGGASNALVNSTTMYVVGQALSGGYWGGNLTVVDLSTKSVSHAAVSISDGAPGASSKMIEADSNTLWIGMTKCTSGVRYNNPSTYGSNYGCLTMYNTSTNSVTLLEPYLGDLTGIAAITGLKKVYVAQGGQIYIYSTVDGSSIDNQYVTVTGTAYDVAYMDGLSDDSDNTTY